MKITFSSRDNLKLEMMSMSINNLPFTRLLSEIDIVDFENVGRSNALCFLDHEVTRVKLSILAIIRTNFLEYIMENSGSQRVHYMLDVLCPIIRVMLEGFIKTQYIFGKDVSDINGISARMAKISEDFKADYSAYISLIAKMKGNVDLAGFSPISKSQCRRQIQAKQNERTINKMLSDCFGKHDSNRTSGDNRVHLLNSWYKFCCFYSHASVNPAIMKLCDIQALVSVSIIDIIEYISENFYLAVMSLADNDDQDEMYKKYIASGGVYFNGK